MKLTADLTVAFTNILTYHEQTGLEYSAVTWQKKQKINGLSSFSALFY